MTTEELRREFEKEYAEAFPMASSKWGKFDRDEQGEYNDPCVFGAWWGFAAGRAAAGKDDWRAMVYAPMDGTEIELLLHHTNRRYADGDDKKMWEAVVRAKWIDHNGGGWTWQGMCGQPVGWRAIDAANTQNGSEG